MPFAVVRRSTAINVVYSGNAFKVAGLLLASLLPALFWSALLLAMSSMFGFEVATSTVITIAVAISCFIGAVCAPLILR